MIKGLDTMLGALRKVANKFPDYVAAAMYQEAQLMMTESKRRCPVDTGDLRASGRVAPPVREGKRISVTLSYGGAAAPYAIYVHENIHANHNRPPFQGGQAKFLESVLNERRADLAQAIAARVNLNRMKVD